ncbi:adenylosuccinate lyase [Veillonella magna]|jgi:adenylosuccinate lyase|uniref:Adenylosuccinate lyase n=1 Tax=Veillonella magna TaxID=464322 RepID=A0ABS2GJY7_9FIRM|nr:adenylosuccinate lyase [Veillonella magna]MBM6825279.1 adenylosuccinate lyase [Veillonella magna]MBM6913573.1 adenylosuccinate lyase [Veillonella magna]
MIARYTREEMGHIWSERNEFDTMLQVEILACEAQAELGVIPKEAAKVIREKADFEVERIHEIEKETNHDIISFVTAVGEHVGEEAKYIHLGLTSTDVKDTALGYMMKQACDILLADLHKFHDVLRRRAVEFKYTPMVGRTHGIHGEPTTFGLKMCLWMAEIERDIERLEHAKKNVAVGKLSGAVGTYSVVDPFVEKYVCEKLGLEPVKIATQVVQRDRHAELCSTIAIIGSTLDKIALEIRHLQRTEVREAEEYFSPKQKGSSAMPHKRNPITCERICGLARVLRGNAQAALEDVALWHERDISHSSVERVILPDSTITLDYMLHLVTRVIDKLLVYPENMKKNLELTGGLIFSQRVLTALVDKGAFRDNAYRWVQRHAMARWLEGKDFLAGLKSDEDIKKYLTDEEIEACFDPHAMLKHVDTIMGRFGL